MGKVEKVAVVRIAVPTPSRSLRATHVPMNPHTVGTLVANLVEITEEAESTVNHKVLAAFNVYVITHQCTKNYSGTSDKGPS